MADFSLDSVLSSNAPNSSTDPSISSGSSSAFSLNDLFGSAIQTAANGVAGGISSAISNVTRSSNTAPTPDLTAKAATPGSASSFLSSKVGGISVPIVLGVGAAAILLYVILKRR